MEELFSQAVPAGNLILGVGDNVVADGLLERVMRVSSMVTEAGLGTHPQIPQIAQIRDASTGSAE